MRQPVEKKEASRQNGKELNICGAAASSVSGELISTEIYDNAIFCLCCNFAAPWELYRHKN